MTMGSETSTITVASQNVLLDYTRARKGLILSQDERIATIAATFENFPVPFDVVGIQEAHNSKRQHNGEALSEGLGYGQGFWVNHNQKSYPESLRGRSNEYMGLFGTSVHYCEVIELGDNRRALFTTIADVAFVTVHLRAGWDGRKKRRTQARALNKEIEAFENVVVMGDLNEPPIPLYAAARSVLAGTGFQSVFSLTGQPHPVTFPVESYRNASPWAPSGRNELTRRAGSLDDIMVRGPRVQVVAAGVLERVVAIDAHRDIPAGTPLDGSDHEGIWATLEIQ